MNTRPAREFGRSFGAGFHRQPLPLPAWRLLWALVAVLPAPLRAQGLGAPAAKGQALPASTSAHGSVAASYGKLPLSFEANQGQSDPRVKFLARGNGYSLFLTDSSAVLSLRKPNPAKKVPRRRGAPEPTQDRETDVIRMDLPGASRGLRVSAADRLPGTENYFIGNDPSRWHSNIPTFGRVRYSSVYPGVDLVYYGNQRQLEYDFVVAPNADPKPIRLRFAGARTLQLDAAGNLLVIANNGQVAFHKPEIYQEMAGIRQPVEGRFTLIGKHTAGFILGAYDSARPLTIDPVLAYSTYLGGSLEDEANAIAVDSSGNAYVAGLTVSSDFPVTASAFQSSNDKTSNSYTAFVTKLNSTGTALLYSTYVGGSTEDVANAIAVDRSGNAYLAGYTSSTDFPVTTDAFQSMNKTSGASTGFVTELNATGTALVYSTYLGGSDAEGVNGIAVDGSGDAYVTGFAGSTDFPVTAGVLQSKNNSSTGTAFVAELNPTGTALVYATYLGGSFGDVAYGIALDGSGSAYVAGWTGSPDFPVTARAFQTINNDPGASSTELLGNAFVSKLNATGTGLHYSTYLGGNGGGTAPRLTTVEDQASAIAVDGSGNAYVTGFAYSTDFPTTTGAFQKTNNAGSTGNSNAFVTKLNATGTALLYSTYLGGSEGNPATGITSEGAYAIAADSSGNAYVAGTASSDDFPVTPGAFQVMNKAGYDSAFVTRLNQTGTALVYSTYLSGSTLDGARALALDSASNAYIAGLSDSPNFPISAGAFQTKNKSNAFGTCLVAKMDLSYPTIATSTTLTSSANPQGAGLPMTITAIVAPASGNGIPTGSAVFTVNGKTSVDLPLVSGAANITADDFLPGTFVPGTYTIAATYSPDAAGSVYASSSGTLTQTITTSSPIATTTTLTSSANPQAAGSPVTFTVTVKPASGTYAPTGTITTTVDGGTGPTLFLSNGVASITTSALAAGTHTIVATYIPDANSSDYQSSSASLVQTISGAAAASIAVFSGSAQTTAYGSAFANPLVAVVKDGSGNPVAGAVVSFSGAGLKFSSSSVTTGANGEASVTATAVAAGSLTATAGTTGVSATASFKLTATPVALIVTAGNASRIYEASNPTFTDIITGFVNGDPPSVVSGAVALSTTATASSPVGSYPITAAQGTLSAANYTFDFVSGTLTITQATPAISWAAPAAIAYGTALSATQLDASSTVSGTFAYSPASGAVLTPGAHTLSVTLTPADSADYTGASTSVTLEVGPEISTQPASETVVDGAKATFSVKATGTATLTYAWQYLSGTTWKSFGAGTGLNTATLTTVATTAAFNGLQFRVVVTDGNGLTASSNTVRLGVSPAVTTQPVSQTVTDGSAATFSVAAAGVPTLKYQWQYLSGSTWKDFGAGTGSTMPTLTTVETTAAFNGLQFRVVVTDGDGLTAASNTVKLTVGPTITAQPENQTVAVGSTATFSVTAAGAPTLKYQWQYLSGSTWKDFGAGTGYTTATLTTFATTPAFNGLQFRCVVTDGDGLTATSNLAALTVQ